MGSILCISGWPTTASSDTLPQTQPASDLPLQTQPTSGTPLQTQPASDSPLQTQPARDTPLPTRPASGTPLQTQPASDSSLQTQPARDTPLPTRPASGTPLQTQPIENRDFNDILMSPVDVSCFDLHSSRTETSSVSGMYTTLLFTYSIRQTQGITRTCVARRLHAFRTPIARVSQANCTRVARV